MAVAVKRSRNRSVELQRLFRTSIRGRGVRRVMHRLAAMFVAIQNGMVGR